MDLKEALNNINFYKIEKRGVECEFVQIGFKKIVLRAAEWLTLLSWGYIEITFEKPFYIQADIASTMDSTSNPFIELLSGKEEKQYLNKYLGMDREGGKAMHFFRLNLEEPIVIGAENISYQINHPDNPVIIQNK